MKKAAVPSILCAVAVVAGRTVAPASGRLEEAGGIVRRSGVLTDEEEMPKPRPG